MLNCECQPCFSVLKQNIKKKLCEKSVLLCQKCSARVYCVSLQRICREKSPNGFMLILCLCEPGLTPKLDYNNELGHRTLGKSNDVFHSTEHNRETCDDSPFLMLFFSFSFCLKLFSVVILKQMQRFLFEFSRFNVISYLVRRRSNIQHCKDRILLFKNVLQNEQQRRKLNILGILHF